MFDLNLKHPLYPDSNLEIPIIGLKYSMSEDFPKRYIHDTSEMLTICRALFDEDTLHLEERLYAVYLRNNLILGCSLISIGTANKTPTNHRKILVSALATNATAIFLAHNQTHSSTKPSKADKVQTRQLFRACGYHDLKLIDHIIYDINSYYSFAESGELYSDHY